MSACVQTCIPSRGSYSGWICAGAGGCGVPSLLYSRSPAVPACPAAHADDPSVEFLLPEALDAQRREGFLEVDVLQTDEGWIGLTNREDLEVARALFADR